MKMKASMVMTRREMSSIEELNGKILDAMGMLKDEQKPFTYFNLRIKSKLQHLLYRVRWTDELEIEYDLEIDQSVVEMYTDIVSTGVDAIEPIMKAARKMGQFQEKIETDLEEADVNIETDAKED